MSKFRRVDTTDFMGTKFGKVLDERSKKYNEKIEKKEGKFKPSILNELGELNLLLLEKIYATFEDNSDKVFYYFRRDKFAYLKPRLFKYIGEEKMAKIIPDKGNDSTFLMDGDHEIKNIF
jgi:hypothetical protein